MFYQKNVVSQKLGYRIGNVANELERYNLIVVENIFCCMQSMYVFDIYDEYIMYICFFGLIVGMQEL